ncbi:MAG: hypothetical protein KVP17_005207 [Porospora cf. gigantea B]|uniref:uncharacterized protein n=1 Tax=Porospora cf. gigantea B TaxID=2853592 RepID=UPI003571DF26|nr:MAG: hypothetical protein KVP17_005207 [Porospora cf. gigantea B]
MVTFICDLCQASLKKQQVEKHYLTKCRDAWTFTCLDCRKTFAGEDYKNHSECKTEKEQYWGQYAGKDQGKKPVERAAKDKSVPENKTERNSKRKPDSLEPPPKKSKTTWQGSLSETVATSLKELTTDTTVKRFIRRVEKCADEIGGKFDRDMVLLLIPPGRVDMDNLTVKRLESR